MNINRLMRQSSVVKAFFLMIGFFVAGDVSAKVPGKGKTAAEVSIQTTASQQQAPVVSTRPSPRASGQNLSSMSKQNVLNKITFAINNNQEITADEMSWIKNNWNNLENNYKGWFKSKFPIELERFSSPSWQLPQASQSAGTGIDQASITKIMQASYPWPTEMSNFVSQQWNNMTPAQRNAIDQNYKQKEQDFYRQSAIAQRQAFSAQGQPASQASSTGWSLDKAAAGGAQRAQALLAYGARKVTGGFGATQRLLERAYNSLFGGFGSSVGGIYKFTTGLGAMTMLAIAHAPVLVSTAAFVGGWALTSVADRLEYAYQTGKLSEADAVEATKGALEVILSDKATYPTILTAMSALEDDAELHTLNQDKFGLVKKARNALKDTYKKALDQQDEQKKQFETTIDAECTRIRAGYNPQNTVQELRKYENALMPYVANAHAILSEYYRAKRKADVLENMGKMPETPPAQQTSPAEKTWWETAKDYLSAVAQ